MKHRLQLDFNQVAYDKLLELRKKSGLPNNAEVIRQALSIYLFLLENRDTGLRPGLVNKDDQIEAIISLEPRE